MKHIKLYFLFLLNTVYNQSTGIIVVKKQPIGLFNAKNLNNNINETKNNIQELISRYFPEETSDYDNLETFLFNLDLNSFKDLAIKELIIFKLIIQYYNNPDIKNDTNLNMYDFLLSNNEITTFLEHLMNINDKAHIFENDQYDSLAESEKNDLKISMDIVIDFYSKNGYIVNAIENILNLTPGSLLKSKNIFQQLNGISMENIKSILNIFNPEYSHENIDQFTFVVSLSRYLILIRNLNQKLFGEETLNNNLFYNIQDALLYNYIHDKNKKIHICEILSAFKTIITSELFEKNIKNASSIESFTSAHGTITSLLENFESKFDSKIVLPQEREKFYINNNENRINMFLVNNYLSPLIQLLLNVKDLKSTNNQKLEIIKEFFNQIRIRKEVNNSLEDTYKNIINQNEQNEYLDRSAMDISRMDISRMERSVIINEKSFITPDEKENLIRIESNKIPKINVNIAEEEEEEKVILSPEKILSPEDKNILVKEVNNSFRDIAKEVSQLDNPNEKKELNIKLDINKEKLLNNISNENNSNKLKNFIGETFNEVEENVHQTIDYNPQELKIQEEIKEEKGDLTNLLTSSNMKNEQDKQDEKEKVQEMTEKIEEEIEEKVQDMTEAVQKEIEEKVQDMTEAVQKEVKEEIEEKVQEMTAVVEAKIEEEIEVITEKVEAEVQEMTKKVQAQLRAIENKINSTEQQNLQEQEQQKFEDLMEQQNIKYKINFLEERIEADKENTSSTEKRKLNGILFDISQIEDNKTITNQEKLDRLNRLYENLIKFEQNIEDSNYASILKYIQVNQQTITLITKEKINEKDNIRFSTINKTLEDVREKLIKIKSNEKTGSEELEKIKLYKEQVLSITRKIIDYLNDKITIDLLKTKINKSILDSKDKTTLLTQLNKIDKKIINEFNKVNITVEDVENTYNYYELFQQTEENFNNKIIVTNALNQYNIDKKIPTLEEIKAKKTKKAELKKAEPKKEEPKKEEPKKEVLEQDKKVLVQPKKEEVLEVLSSNLKQPKLESILSSRNRNRNRNRSRSRSNITNNNDFLRNKNQEVDVNIKVTQDNPENITSTRSGRLNISNSGRSSISDKENMTPKKKSLSSTTKVVIGGASITGAFVGNKYLNTDDTEINKIINDDRTI